jgi:hypothetical protein
VDAAGACGTMEIKLKSTQQELEQSLGLGLAIKKNKQNCSIQEQRLPLSLPIRKFMIHEFVLLSLFAHECIHNAPYGDILTACKTINIINRQKLTHSMCTEIRGHKLLKLYDYC